MSVFYFFLCRGDRMEELGGDYVPSTKQCYFFSNCYTVSVVFICNISIYISVGK